MILKLFKIHLRRLNLNTNSNLNYEQILSLIDDNNDETIFEMINKLMSGNYYEAINSLNNFKLNNTSSSSILYLIKSKLKLLNKCLNMSKMVFQRRKLLIINL